MKFIRCSSLPSAFACGGTIQTPDLKINPSSEPANEGNAGHAVMRVIAERDLASIEEVDIGEIARAYHVDADELGFAARNGLAIWRQIRESFPGSRGEVEFQAELVPPSVDFDEQRIEEGVTLTGHADLLARHGARANGADWKFGRVDKDYSEQVRGYMALTLLTYPEIEHVAWTVVWMRERETEPYTMDRAQGLPDWLDRLKRDIVGWDGTYRPSAKTCNFCPRAHECPALAAMARRDVALLTDGDMVAQIERGLVDLPAAQVVGLYRTAKYIANACESLKEAVKLRVEHDGGVLDGDDGTELRYIPSNRREIQTLAAWPVMEARLGAEDIAAVVKVGASRLDDVIAKKAGKGNGASAKRELAQALEAAGAVVVVPGKRLSDQRKK